MKHIVRQGRKISRIALGSTHFGEPMSVAQSEQVMDYAREQGVDFFDTARVYGEWYRDGGRSGYCEKVIGDYLRKRGCRQEIYLATKGAHPPFLNRTASRLKAACLREDLEGSLRDLGTDYVDLYFLHRDHPDADIPEIMETLDAFVREGKVRSIGASNWRLDRILEANAYASAHGLTPFTASQIEWSMAKYDGAGNSDQTQLVLREDEFERYAGSGLLVMCFTAQANGLFSKAAAAGGYEALARQERASGKRGLTGRYHDPDNIRREETVRRLCSQYGLTPAALTVAYLTSQNFDVVPILGCSRLSQLEDSLSSPDFQLSSQDYRDILREAVI